MAFYDYSMPPSFQKFIIEEHDELLVKEFAATMGEKRLVRPLSANVACCEAFKISRKLADGCVSKSKTRLVANHNNIPCESMQHGCIDEPMVCTYCI